MFDIEVTGILSDIEYGYIDLNKEIHYGDLSKFHTDFRLRSVENILKTIREINQINKIITVFWATWDRDKTKRPIMWEIVSKMSDYVILTQDDDYSEKNYGSKRTEKTTGSFGRKWRDCCSSGTG